MSRWHRIAAVIPAALAIFACSETPFLFFNSDEPALPPGSDGTGAHCGNGACGSGGAIFASGGLGGVPDGLASGSASNEGGAPPSPNDRCMLSGTDQKAERIQIVDNELCLARGAFQLLLGQPSYAIKLVECSDDPAQIWVISELSPSVIEARNYSVDLNLDTQFSAVESGTPIDLFTPHQLYNQRFIVTVIDSSSFKLSPLNAPKQCVSAWDGSLLLRTCDNAFMGQRIRRLTCEQ